LPNERNIMKLKKKSLRSEEVELYLNLQIQMVYKSLIEAYKRSISLQRYLSTTIVNKCNDHETLWKNQQTLVDEHSLDGDSTNSILYIKMKWFIQRLQQIKQSCLAHEKEMQTITTTLSSISSKVEKHRDLPFDAVDLFLKSLIHFLSQKKKAFPLIRVLKKRLASQKLIITRSINPIDLSLSPTLQLIETLQLHLKSVSTCLSRFESTMKKNYKSMLLMHQLNTSFQFKDIQVVHRYMEEYLFLLSVLYYWHEQRSKFL